MVLKFFRGTRAATHFLTPNVLIALAVGCRTSLATVGPETMIRDSIEVVLRIPATAHLGESVPLQVTVRNLSSRDRSLEYSDPAPVNFLIATADGSPVWKYLPENVVGVARLDSLPSHGERKFTVTWDQRDEKNRHVGTGSYQVTGWFYGEGTTGDVKLGPTMMEIVR